MVGAQNAQLIRFTNPQALLTGASIQRPQPYTPSAGQYLHDRPLDMRVGASYRHVIDFANPERSSRMITYGGQSGSVGSRHYADQMPLWLAGKSLPMRLSVWPETGRDLRLVRA